MRKLYTKIIVVLVLICWEYNTLANEKYSIEQITVKDGLASNNIRSICRDHLGYLWIGTVSGLHKFDGFSMQKFFYDDENDKSIPNNHINFIIEDDSLNLWIGTRRGLARYNREEDSFSTIVFDENSAGVHSFSKENNQLVFGFSTGLAFFNYKTNEFDIRFFKGKGPDNSILKLASFDSENFVIGSTRNGLWIYNKSSTDITQINDKEIDGVYDVLVDKKGILWVVTNKNGIKLFKKNGEEIFDETINQLIDPQYRFVTDFVEKGSEIYIATDGGGIIIFDQITRKIQKLQHQKRVENSSLSLPSNSITDLYFDHFGNLFVGTVRTGLIWINEVAAQSYSEVPFGNHFGLSNPTVLTLFEGNDDKIWIGTDGGGLNVFDPRRNTFEHIQEFQEGKIVSICGYGEDKLLVSFYHDKIRVFDIKRNTFEKEENNTWLKEWSESDSYVPTYLFDDKYGNIWNFGREKVELKTKDGAIDVLAKNNGWNMKQPITINILQEINKEEFIASGVGGAYLINTSKKSVSNIFSLSNEKWNCEKYNNSIYSMIKIKDSIWMASSIGLFCYDNKNKQIDYYKNKFFSAVHSVTKGVNNSLWLGTNNGLYRYYPFDGSYQLYGRFKGVRIHEYMSGSVLKCRNGDVYFGAADGLVKINANQDTNESLTTPVVSIVDIITDGARKTENQEGNLLNNEIKLVWNNSSLRFNLVVNEKDIFRNRIYRIQFDGYLNEVIETTNPQVYFTHIPNGTYEIKIWCNLKDGSWPVEYTSISLFVPLPWWKRWWFIGSVISLTLFIFIQMSLDFKKQEKLKAELFIERERKEQQKLLHKKKQEFFTNISHELRTPLSLVYGPLKRLLGQQAFTREEVFRNIKVMHEATLKMKRLIEQVLDIRKFEIGIGEIKLDRLYLNNWLHNYVKQFELEFETKSITLVVKLPEKEEVVTFDEDKLDKILSNLLINAIKYSPQHGQVFLSYTKKVDKIEFVIADQGPGILEKEKEVIFDRFFQGSNHLEGSGIGLTFVRKLIEFQQGKIWVNNRPEGGAEFRFYLPYINYVLSKNDNAPAFDKICSDKSEFVQNNDFELLKDKVVLVVEDDIDLRTFIVKGLDQHCKVIEATNGEEAWHLALSHLPDIIISDIMMPKMNGFQLCEKIKNDVRVSHLVVVLLTAKNDEESRLLGYKGGADAYLSKPFSLDLLSVRLVNIIENRSHQKELVRVKQKIVPALITYNNTDEVFLKRVITIIENNLDNPNFNVNMLNAEFAMSRSTFYAKMKTISDLGVNEFIKLIRIDFAAELLKNTNLPVNEIAMKVGFDNQRYFSTVFKEMKNCTPTQYREIER
ncbi:MULTISPECIES: hybrid sensor histidine kinase/response regulator transcription factor [Aquimarina]|uniref:hybrid sensor histidine kinase/response regulator transcription factor n=1 Tax=Aquimarina TaxID=290174 RepID=UPI000942A51E|nr:MULTISPECIES: hybrid sensor histidine kinase/response regulator transcription factor [Aquimarina]